MADFATDSVKLLEIARLSPSSHNTQPWKVAIDTTAQQLTIGFDPGRQLAVGDPDKRELHLSLGCFIESLMLAAPELGYDCQLTVTNLPPAQVATVTFSTRTIATRIWSEHIIQRRSERKLYDTTALTPETVTALANVRQGAAHLQLFTQPAAIAQIAAATERATLTAMSNPDFRDELAGWVRHNWTRQPDGMPAFVQGIPGPVSLIAPLVIRKNKAVAKDQAKKDSARVSHSAAIGLIIIPDQSVINWLDSGRVYQRACVLAQSLGVKSAALSAAIIDPLTTKQLISGLPLDAQPVGLLRFGYVNHQQKASPRLSVAQITS